ncbi:MAG: substrate-binding domain-containing protein [Nitrospiraceae bacterium]
MSEQHKAERPENVDNRLRAVRLARGWSSAQLAAASGITRQAVYAIEANQYLPTTAVALRLAGALQCRVEDLFALMSSGPTVDGEWADGCQDTAGESGRRRVKLTQVGDRIMVRPVRELGEVLTYMVAADGVTLDNGQPARRDGRRASVRVELLREWSSIRDNICVAGCDPAIMLAGEYVRRRQPTASVVAWTAGSASAIDQLKAGTVHVAGVHVVDRKTGESNLPFLRRALPSSKFTVVSFASWEAGLIVGAGNPKGLREVGDLARRDVSIVNREGGSGARLLLDQRLHEAGIKPAQVKSYTRTVSSHVAVARAVADGQAQAGIGVRAAAQAFGLGFVPLQEERYDLVMATATLTGHPSLQQLLDAMVSRAFRSEVEALGGYDTRVTGTVQPLSLGKAAAGRA